jgi:hypothetical protein
MPDCSRDKTWKVGGQDQRASVVRNRCKAARAFMEKRSPRFTER